MRLSDLITFIRLCTEQTASLRLSDDERLTLLKEAFPRRDLLHWFDDEAGAQMPPAWYLPALLVRSAIQISVRHAQTIEVCCGGQPHLDLMTRLTHRPPDQLVTWKIRGEGSVEQTAAPRLHEVGLLHGFFAKAAERAAFDRCMQTNFYHSNRLCFMNDAFYTSCIANAAYQPPSKATLIALLQNWGGERLHVAYVSKYPLEGQPND